MIQRHTPRILDRAHPIKVWVGGDSLSEGPGGMLQSLLARTGVSTYRPDCMYSTGLTRTNVRDWRRRFRGAMARWDPDVAVVIMGASDPQPIHTRRGSASFASARWQAEYARRVRESMDTLQEDGRLVIWVGMPVMRVGHPIRNSRNMAVLNRLFIQEAANRPNVTYVDSWKLFSTPSGEYTEALPGTPRLRARDGIHFSYAGGKRLAHVLFERIDERWNLGQYLGPRSGQNSSAVASRLRARNSQVEQVVVDARLLKAPPHPDPLVIAPYRRALAIEQYQVEKVLHGRCPKKIVSVARWCILNAAAVPSYRVAGRLYRITLDRFQDHPEVEGHPRFPDNFDDPRFFEKGGESGSISANYNKTLRRVL